MCSNTPTFIGGGIRAPKPLDNCNHTSVVGAKPPLMQVLFILIYFITLSYDFVPFFDFYNHLSIHAALTTSDGFP